MNEAALVILCTAPAEGDTAATLARGLVEAKLAACVNILPNVRSYYRWQGQVQDDSEVQLVIKTRADRYAEVEHWIRAHHPYEVPEILALSVQAGSAPYLAWLNDNAR